MSTPADGVITPTRGTIWFRTGPPRILRGLSVRGYAVRFGVLLPPAGGPARAGRALGEISDLRAAIADVLAFAVQRLGHAGNGHTN